MDYPSNIKQEEDGRATTPYKQGDNRELIAKVRIQRYFKQLCDHTGHITLNTLGTFMERNKIPFELEELRGMLTLNQHYFGKEAESQQKKGMEQTDKDRPQPSTQQTPLLLSYPQFMEMYFALQARGRRV